MNWPSWLPIAVSICEQVSVGLLDLAAEDLHDAQDVAVDRDREGERAVQPLRGPRRRRAGKLVSVTTSGIQAGWPLAQTRPGKPDAAVRT